MEISNIWSIKMTYAIKTITTYLKPFCKITFISSYIKINGKTFSLIILRFDRGSCSINQLTWRPRTTWKLVAAICNSFGVARNLLRRLIKLWNQITSFYSQEHVVNKGMSFCLTVIYFLWWKKELLICFDRKDFLRKMIS